MKIDTKDKEPVKFMLAGGTVDVHPDVASYIKELQDIIRKMEVERAEIAIASFNVWLTKRTRQAWLRLVAKCPGV